MRSIIGAGVESTSRIALASALVQYGGADFDASSGTRAISTLLEGKFPSEHSIAFHRDRWVTFVFVCITYRRRRSSYEKPCKIFVWYSR